MRTTHLILPVTMLILLTGPLLAAEVRFNEAQVIGTHNSYHIAPHDALLALIAKENPDRAKALRYSHRSLPEQFSLLGIRQIELDVFADPRGGLYGAPLGNKRLAEQGLPAGPPHDPEGLLRKPGFKVLHAPDVDFRSTALTFVEGLQQIREWSAKHRRHFPIFVLIELKEDSLGPEFTQPVRFGAGDLDGVEQEILSVFKRKQILTPDDVRGGFATLPEAIARRGWPKLDAVRGKVLFALDNGEPLRDLYLKGHPTLQGRLMFVSVEETHPAAAWMKVNDPIGEFERIQKLVKAGFIVRTRADADTVEARANDTRRREKAFASGAQFISTDYPEANAAFSLYAVRFENGVTVRTNPINGNPALAGKDLEKLFRKK